VRLSLLKIWLRILVLGIGMDVCAGQKIEGRGYLGFDRNEYPGDVGMRELRKEFAFAGYWLTPAPGEKTNSWAGRHRTMEAQGYGFLLLARGRPVSAVRTVASAKQRGIADAQEAAHRAKAEGFADGAIIFLDVEDGGRLPALYHAYLRAWADELMRLGFRPGVYCSGIVVDEGDGATIVTAEDIRTNEAPRVFAYWAFNDACPPSPGCVRVENPPLPSASGVKDAAVWQFVRSPREKETAGKCSGYAADENCYAAADAARKWHLDMNVAATANPSFGR
jgi:glycoside hydrolase-like protein